MISLDSILRFSLRIRYISISMMCFCSDCAASGEAFWNYLAQHNASIELMDVAPGSEHFFIAGTRTVIIPWDDGYTPEVESIIPPLQRKLLMVLNINRDQTLVWRKEYANLPDVHEVYSMASTANNQLCIVYGSEPWEETAINPLVLRVDSTGESLWFKPVFPSTHVASSNFLTSERIANLDAINVAEASNNECLVAFITRSVQSQSETFRLHLIRYDSQGGISWHSVFPTDLYGTTYLFSNDSVSRHFVLLSNLSRDAALEAMILGQPFLPQIRYTSINSDGKVLHDVDLSDTLAGAWLYNAITLPPDSLLLIGKIDGPWLARIQSDGRVTNKLIDKTNAGDAFQAIISRGKDAFFIIAHDGKISLFDNQLRLQSRRSIHDITVRTFEDPRLSSVLPEDLAVEKLIALDANHYLLFYKYGSRIVEINLGQNSMR